MKSGRLITFFFILFAGVLGLTGYAHAGGEEFFLSVSPSFPKAGQNFTVEARSLTFDRARADIKWYVNGVLYSSGVGKVEETFTASGIGTTMNIQVAATTEKGGTYQDETSIDIGSIDFIVSGDTYVPPFYRGAAWPTIGSNMTVRAIPHLYIKGKRVPTENIVYSWKLNNEPMYSQSGGGKNKLSFFVDNLRGQPHKISLLVSDRANTVQFEDSIDPPVYSPQLLFYEYRPLLGPAPLAGGSFSVNPGDTTSVIAEPYFFGLTSLKRSLFTWTLNGKPVEGSAKNPLLLDLTAPSDGNVQGRLRLLMKDPKSFFQRAESQFLISSKEE